MSAERVKEYQELKAFFMLWYREVTLRMMPPEMARNMTMPFQETDANDEGSASALEGLKQAINDIMEETEHWPPETIRKIDTALATEGYVTLSALRRRYRARYAGILKRQKIRNDTEFYLLSGVASDMSLELAEDERRLIERLLFEYEEKRT